jgi:transcriptional regulator with XRE-family HTH domain
VAETSRIRKQLGAELRAARQLAGLTQRDMRDRLPTSQAAVSRYERGEGGLPPTRHLVTRWLEICEVSDEATRDRVLALVEAAHNESRSWLEMLGDGTHLQGIAQDREAAARLVRVCQMTMVPGLLQTAEYARQLMPQVDPFNKFDHAAAVAARMDRQRILYEEGRRFEFLIAEHALRWSPGPGVMPAQLDRLVSMATLSAVEVAILPTRREGALEWHNFDLLELADGSASFVTAELVHGGQLISDPELVAPYVSLWDRLRRASAVGDEARAVIERVRADLG